MTARILTALCLSLALAGANAQTTPPAPPAPKPAAGDEAKSAASDTPPDEKAYREAGKMADPEKKIAALEGIKKDFPDSRYVSAANWQIFNTLIQKMPDQKERIRKAAKALFAASVAKDRATSRENKITTMASRGSTAERIADQLTTAGLLLKDAESYARRSEKALSENVWMAEQRAAYAREKMNVPSQEAMAKDFAETRASRIGVLGRVELKLGRTAEAQKLLDESYAVTPSDEDVAAALGDLAVKAGDDAKAMEYLLSARLSGRAPDTANQAFETLYKKGHNGSSTA